MITHPTESCSDTKSCGMEKGRVPADGLVGHRRIFGCLVRSDEYDDQESFTFKAGPTRGSTAACNVPEISPAPLPRGTSDFKLASLEFVTGDTLRPGHDIGDVLLVCITPAFPPPIASQ